MNACAAPPLSVVIPTFNRRASLERTLTSIADEAAALDAEVIVVTDGCTDGTDEMLERYRPPHRFLHVRQHNQGPSAARNRGVDHSSAPIILFIDDDTEPCDGLLEGHLRQHGSATDRAVIGPMVSPPEGESRPWLAWESEMLRRQYSAYETGAVTPGAGGFYTANASLHRDLFDRSGGFDVRYRRGEDVELGRRLRALDAEFVFTADSAVVHRADRTFPAWAQVARSYGAIGALEELTPGGPPGWSLRRRYHDLHVGTRTVIRLTVGRPGPLRLVGAAATRVAELRWRSNPRSRISYVLFSALHNMFVFDGAATELGGRRALFDRLDGRRASRRPQEGSQAPGSVG